MRFDPTVPDQARWQHAWTLATPLHLEGPGLHSGHLATVRVVPAPAGHGLVFHRVDWPGSPAIPARVEHVVDTTLSTVLGVGEARIGTVEHLVAGLWGMGVTDARIEVDGPEVPILDGSAAPVVAAIREAGVVALASPRPVFGLPETQVVSGAKAMRAQSGADATVTYIVDYDHPHAGVQIFHGVITPALFARELAPARTFCFLADIEAMRRAGLAKGGSVDNAVVIAEDGPMTALRFPDELVRHKVLDLVGDMALWGAWWQGHIIAVKAGHALHNQLARRVSESTANVAVGAGR